MKKLLSLILIVLSFSFLSVSAQSIETKETIDNYLSNFSDEKISELQINAGNNFDDWFILSFLRSEKEIDPYLYKGMLRHYIYDNYQLDEKLSKNLMTEWHRLILLCVASGLDPREVEYDGKVFDLLYDGVFNTKKTEKLEKQGINSFIFALIALDSFSFEELSSNDYHSRKSLIEGILSYELVGGGFSFNKEEADIDMSALVLQGLSEYYNSLETYTIYNKIQKKIIETTVKEVIDRILILFSNEQKDDGDFESYGVSNVESTAQVLIGLASLGIDIQSDNRFIKNGKTVYDGVLKYQDLDGNFRRNENSNKISGYQAFLGLVAYDRLLQGKRSIYDLKPEMNNEVKEKINNLIENINNLEDLSIIQLENLLKNYKEIPGSERNYVYNFHSLYNKLIDNNIEVIIEEDYSEEALLLEKQVELTNTEIQKIIEITNLKKIECYPEMIYFQEKIKNSHIDEEINDALNKAIKNVKTEKKQIALVNKMIKDYLITENQKLQKEIINNYNSLLQDSKQYVIDYQKVVTQSVFSTRNIIIVMLSITSISILAFLSFKTIKKKRERE